MHRLFFKQTPGRRVVVPDGKSPVIAFLRARNSDGNGETGDGKEEENDAGRKAEVGGEERGGIGKISKQISD